MTSATDFNNTTEIKKIEKRIVDLCEIMCNSGKFSEWYALDKNFVELCELRMRESQLEREIKRTLAQYE